MSTMKKALLTLAVVCVALAVSLPTEAANKYAVWESQPTVVTDVKRNLRAAASWIMGLVDEVAASVVGEDVLPEEENYKDMPQHFAHVAALVQRVMDEHAGTPELRKGLVETVLKTLRLNWFDAVPDLSADFDVQAMLTQIGGCGSENPYLDPFIKVAAYKNVWGDKTDKGDVIPLAFAYTVVLNRITNAARTDREVLRKLSATLKEKGESFDWAKYANMFERAKKKTIDHVVEQYLDMHDAREVPGNWGARTLPLNICEACLEDYRVGVPDNAKAGLAIAFERPGSDEFDFKTHAGPSTFSPDGHAILYKCPLPKSYADMYSTWNLAFVSHYGDAPMFWAKLVNPQVFCYKENPEEYLYNRVIALFLHINYEVFQRYDAQSLEPPYQWNDGELTQNWAKNNLHMSERYETELEAARGESQSWAKDKIRRTMEVFGESSTESLEQFGEFLRQLESEDADGMSIIFILGAARRAGGIVWQLVKAVIWS